MSSWRGRGRGSAASFSPRFLRRLPERSRDLPAIAGCSSIRGSPLSRSGYSGMFTPSARAAGALKELGDCSDGARNRPASVSSSGEGSPEVSAASEISHSLHVGSSARSAKRPTVMRTPMSPMSGGRPDPLATKSRCHLLPRRGFVARGVQCPELSRRIESPAHRLTDGECCSHIAEKIVASLIQVDGIEDSNYFQGPAHPCQPLLGNVVSNHDPYGF